MGVLIGTLRLAVYFHQQWVLQQEKQKPRSRELERMTGQSRRPETGRLDNLVKQEEQTKPRRQSPRLHREL